MAMATAPKNVVGVWAAGGNTENRVPPSDSRLPLEIGTSICPIGVLCDGCSMRVRCVDVSGFRTGQIKDFAGRTRKRLKATVRPVRGGGQIYRPLFIRPFLSTSPDMRGNPSSMRPTPSGGSTCSGSPTPKSPRGTCHVFSVI